MFGRSESEQIRVLLRLIERQQRTIDNLTDRLMYLAGQTWMPPPVSLEPIEQLEEEGVYVSALDGLPPTEEDYAGQPD
jgi:hypothetical protein